MTSAFQLLENRRTIDVQCLSFGLSTLALIVLSAFVAAAAPIQFSIGIVFLFAAPHNWMELRYCLSRLPSKLGPLKPFFATSFIGLALLFGSYIALVVCARTGMLDANFAVPLLMTWNVSLIAWCLWLAILRWRTSKARLVAVLLAAVVLAASVSSPRWFSLVLVYAHPFIGLCVLDRELVRTRRSWLAIYRKCLLVIPAVVLGFLLSFSGSESLPCNNLLEKQIIRHAGSSVLPDVSSHLLVSLHTFLEMLHYGVWCVAIPVATRAISKWKVETAPALASKPTLQKVAALVMLLSTLAVVSFWTGFVVDFQATRDFYFTIAMVHVLGEIPFLMWLCPASSRTGVVSTSAL